MSSEFSTKRKKVSIYIFVTSSISANDLKYTPDFGLKLYIRKLKVLNNQVFQVSIHFLWVEMWLRMSMDFQKLMKKGALAF